MNSEEARTFAKMLRGGAQAIFALAFVSFIYGLFVHRTEPLGMAISDLAHIPVGAAILIAPCLIAARVLERRSRGSGSSD